MQENADEKEKRLYRLLGSLTRVRILLFLLEHKDQRAYQREIMFETDLSLNPVQRELANLFLPHAPCGLSRSPQLNSHSGFNRASRG